MVQALKTHTPGDGTSWEAWEDIATVTVPHRHKRREVYAKALAEHPEIRPEVGGEPLRLRALDAPSARETRVTARQPDPQLEIG